ncbi:hypothetical protein MNBD_GAMMA16-1823 [hydrothermal vent metagenome]|uniref:Type II secretion system protein H n=1 Tax=hydrothermal vent metagenome TaxID=652676 RepID=A0A3B0ZGV3_9ZZZZ
MSRLNPHLSRPAYARLLKAGVNKKSFGFTLLEMLIVVFIIGIILSMATLSTGPQQYRLLKEEAQRITTLMSLARQESILEAQELAFALNDKTYQFQVFDGKTWLSLADDEVLRERQLPSNMVLEVNLYGETITFTSDNSETDDGDTESEEEEDENRIRILFLSSGEVTPFELFLRYDDQDQGLLVKGDMMGNFTIIEEDEL